MRERIARVIAKETGQKLERVLVDIDRDHWMSAQDAIDEAVELARRFGADPSPAFVNGVLDAVARTLEARGTAHDWAGIP